MPVVTAGQAGKLQTEKAGTVQSVTPVMIEPDLGPNYSVGREVGSSIGRLDPLGVPAAMGGKVGQNMEKTYGRRPGQTIEVRLDDGTVVTITQDARPIFTEGERVRVVMYGDEARVEFMEPPAATL